MRSATVVWVFSSLCAGVMASAPGAAAAQSVVVQRPFAVERFATLPPEADFPQGIAVDPRTGDVFVGTFDLRPDGSGTNFILRFSRRGRLESQLAVGPIPVTGLAFNPRDRKIYFGRPAAFLGLDSLVQRVPRDFDSATPVEDVVTVENVGAPPPRTEITLDGQPIVTTFPDSIAAPNQLLFTEREGRSILQVTDPLQGALYSFRDPELAGPSCDSGTGPCPELLEVMQITQFASSGLPQLGINGLTAIERSDGGPADMFVTNTGDSRLLRLLDRPPFAETVTDSLNGAAAIVPGPAGTLIVSRALEDSVAIVDPENGRILAEIGEFRGIRRDGSPRGLLFPASIARFGDDILAGNLALPLTGNVSEPESDVRKYTISRVRIPRRFPGR